MGTFEAAGASLIGTKTQTQHSSELQENKFFKQSGHRMSTSSGA